MEKIYLDRKGYNDYLNEIEKIKEKIKQNNSDITTYQSDDAFGDGWHDNFAYEQAIKKENNLFNELESKVKALENIIIVEDENTPGVVGINSIVEIKFDDEEESEEYILTGGMMPEDNGDIISITLNSPLGSSIYKKKINDKFSYEVNKNIISGIIVNIK